MKLARSVRSMLEKLPEFAEVTTKVVSIGIGDQISMRYERKALNDLAENFFVATGLLPQGSLTHDLAHEKVLSLRKKTKKKKHGHDSF